MTYEGSHDGAPQSLTLKTGLVGAPVGDWVGGRNEVAFYSKVASSTRDGILLRCFNAHWDDDTRDWHLLLEDVTDSHFVATAWPLPPTLEQCEIIVRTLARFHAAWWNDPRLGTTVGQFLDAASAEQFRQRLAGNFAAFADHLGGSLSVERRELCARLIEQLPRLAARKRSHWTIIHGDAHVWNCFLPRTPAAGGAKLFDWDAWRLGAGTADLGYTMAMHWYPELRQRAEWRLLDAYHDELMANGFKVTTAARCRTTIACRCCG